MTSPGSASPFDPYDQLARISSEPGPQGSRPRLAAIVSHDLRSRLRASRQYRLGDRPFDDRYDDWVRNTSRGTSGAGLVLLAIALSFGALAFGIGVCAVALPAVFLGSVALDLRRRRRFIDLHVQDGSAQCAACGYDLAGLPDDIPQSWIGASIGPRRCPECGHPWPLVPRTG